MSSRRKSPVRAEVSRAGAVVTIAVEMPDDYRAIAYYDEICAAMAKGYVALDFRGIRRVYPKAAREL